MAFSDKAKKWLQENAPNLIENKYLGMVYDRFASLPQQQQRMYTGGALGLVVLVCGLWILFSYVTLFDYEKRSTNAQEMLAMIAQYERAKSAEGGDFAQIDKNRELGRSGALKNYLMSQARTAKISARSIRVEETIKEPTAGDEESPGPRMKVAKVELDKLNLQQLVEFLQSVEYGIYTVGISSLKVENDAKYRGYMNVQMEVIAHLLEAGDDQ